MSRSCVGKVAAARLPRLNLMAKTVTAIMAAITCCNPIGQVEGPKVPAMASDPCEMEFLLDSGAGRNLLSKDSMPDEWLPCVVDPPENLIFRTGGGERKSMNAIVLQGQVSGLNTFYTLESCPHALSLGIQVNQHKIGFVWLADELPYLVRADRLGDLKHFCPESAKILLEVRENVPLVRELIGAAPAESERVDRAYWGIPEMRCCDETIGIDPKDLVVPPTDLPGLPKSEPPKAVAPPDWPKGGDKSLKLKPEKLPHLGDEIMLCEEPNMEPLDKPLDEEDEEANPWTPSLRWIASLKNPNRKSIS